MLYINGKLKSFIGDNNADNGISTSSVVSNRDGSVLERLEWIIYDLEGTTDLDVFKDGPTSVEVGSKVTFSVSLIDRDSGSVATVDIVPGTYTVYNASGASDWTSFATGNSSESVGLVYIDYTFATPTWEEEDNFKVVFTGIRATLATQTAYVQDAIFTGRITGETDIEGKVDTIDGIVDAIQSTLTDVAANVIGITGYSTAASLSEVAGNVIGITGYSTSASLSEGLAGIINITGYSTAASLSDGLGGIVDIKAVVDAITGYATSASLSGGLADLVAIDTVVDAIKVSTDKQAGSVATGTATQNWNAAEADIASIGTNDTSYKLHSLIVDINALHVGGTVSLRMYSQINGTERKVYDEDFVKGTDPDGIWLVDGTVGIHEPLRVTAESTAATDDGAVISYDYMLETM